MSTPPTPTEAFAQALDIDPRCSCLSSFDGSGDGNCPVHGPETEDEFDDEADDYLDDCSACDAPLSTCSPMSACCDDCTHDANWPTSASVVPEQENKP